MAARLPLVITAGKIEQLQPGDSVALPDSSLVLMSSFVSSGAGKITSAASGGGGQIVVASSLGVANGVTSDACGIYWIDQNTGIWSCPLGGGTPALIVNVGPNNLVDITSDGVNLYFTNTGNPANIYTAPIAGGPPGVVFANGQANPRGISSDGANVYWANADNDWIMKLSVAGGTPTQWVGAQIQPYGCSSDGANVYWTLESGTGSVVSAPVATGTPTVVATNQGGASLKGCSSDGSYIYWAIQNATNSKIMRMPATGAAGTPVLFAGGSAYTIFVHARKNTA